MAIGRNLGIAGLCLVVAACGDPTPEPVGRPMTRIETASVKGEGGRTVDAATMTGRRIAGTWRGNDGGSSIEMTFGGDGSLSLQAMRDGGIVDAATGSWKEKGGSLSGTTKGATAELARYASWSAAFSSDTSMNVSGSDGAIFTVRRR